jgi:hypothetical protein
MCFINDNIPEYIQQKNVMERTRNDILTKKGHAEKQELHQMMKFNRERNKTS